MGGRKEVGVGGLRSPPAHMPILSRRVLPSPSLGADNSLTSSRPVLLIAYRHKLRWWEMLRLQTGAGSGRVTLAIAARDIGKRFHTRSWPRRSRSARTVLDRVDVAVEAGSIHALLGPNGAGKSTLVRVLCGLITPDSGEASVGGVPLTDDRRLRGAVGLVFGGDRGLYPRLTGRQHLAFFAALRGLRGTEATTRIDELLAQVQLTEAAQRPTQQYSTGMRQRLAIATALLHGPRVLFLDEPTRSLDPVARRDLHQLLRERVAGAGATVLLVTHDLAEAEAICAAATILSGGRVVATGSPDDLRRRVQAGADASLEQVYHLLMEES